MADEQSERAFIRALAAGRAMLLLGQQYAPTLMLALMSDIAAALSADPAESLRRQLLDRIQVTDLPNVRRAMGLHTAPDELVEIASQPWSYVLVSAVDTIPVEAFRKALGLGRRLRLLSPSQIGGQRVRSSVDTLTIVRLFGSVDEEEVRHLPPLTQLTLRQRRSFEVAAVLHQLPSLVGPHGCLAVVGVTPEDWLDLEDIGLACSQLPAESVHWFDTNTRHQELAIAGDALVLHSDSILAVIRRHASRPEGTALQLARDQLLNPQSRVLTVRRAGGLATPLHLTPEEWRNVRQVGVLLDDSILNPPRTLTPEETREAFRTFLRHQQYLPDWEGIARGFLFQRDQGPSIVDDTERVVERLGSVHARQDTGVPIKTLSALRAPILLTGPPACGKSRLLHWLALQLRRRDHAVLYLLTPSGRVQFEAVERVCRVIESKGAQSVLVLADGLDDASYAQLNEHLASSGRNALVVGTRSASQRDDGNIDDPRKRSETTQFQGVPVPQRLTSSELQRFRAYLGEHGYADVAIQPSHMAERYFLVLLYRLLPDSRGNIHLSLAQEYDRLLSALDRIRDQGEPDSLDQSWKQQLEAVRGVLYPDAVTTATAAQSPLTHSTSWERAVRLSLFCSQIGNPLPRELLLRTQDSGFLRLYAKFAEALDNAALLQEVSLDEAGAVVLDADHPVIAQLALATVMPRRSDQVELLVDLVDAVTWDEAAFPGDRPDQDYCTEILRAIGPRGVAEREFQSPQALESIAGVLRRIRAERGVRLPRLLVLEANTLRLLADRSLTDHDTQAERCREALEVLDMAEGILSARRPTPARNTELRNVLNTRAAVRGFMIGNELQQYRRLVGPEGERLRERILAGLDEVEELAARSWGVGGASFYPLDVTFWAYRDTFEQLGDLSESERAKLLERMEEVLDAATEEPIEADQGERYRRRVVNLAQLQGRIELSRELAARMREAGDFSGECLLIRADVFDPGTRKARSTGVAQAGLGRLESFGARVYESREAVELMHHLWLGAFLPGAEIGGSGPVRAACTREAWESWRRILEARVRLRGPEHGLFSSFCLAWALFELEEPRMALQEIRAVEPLSGGSRRRVGCLVVFSDASGNPKRYRGSVRRREGDVLVAYVPALLTEVRIPPGISSHFSVLPQVGEELGFELGLNYRGLLPWRVV